MKKTFTINIDPEESKELEKRWYECNSTQNLLGFLASQSNTVDSIMQQYADLYDVRFTKCELMKAALANKYKPDEVDLTKYNYSFDFQEQTLTFTEA